MHVPFIDLSAPYKELKLELDAAYQRVMDSGWYILGQELQSFEDEFANYCTADYCVGVGNGLEALFLLLKAYEIGAGDEVIVPANTYIATWLAVSHAGAVPVPVEPDARTCNIDPDLIESAITSKTKAVIAVHLYGQSADMEPIRVLAEKYGLKIIEDAAQAQGAKYDGKRTGSLGDAGGFSFYPAKNIGAYGDGGAVVTSDKEVFERVRLLRNYGSKEKYHNEVIGYNSRLDELQASFLRIKLKVLDSWNSRRKAIADEYLNGLRRDCDLILPEVIPQAEHVWHQFVIRIERRDQLRDHLLSEGVQTAIHYPVAPHKSGAYSSDFIGEGKFNITNVMSQQCISLPIGPHQSSLQTEYVIETVNKALVSI